MLMRQEERCFKSVSAQAVSVDPVVRTSSTNRMCLPSSRSGWRTERFRIHSPTDLFCCGFSFASDCIVSGSGSVPQGVCPDWLRFLGLYIPTDCIPGGAGAADAVGPERSGQPCRTVHFPATPFRTRFPFLTDPPLTAIFEVVDQIPVGAVRGEEKQRRGLFDRDQSPELAGNRIVVFGTVSGQWHLPLACGAQKGDALGKSLSAGGTAFRKEQVKNFSGVTCNHIHVASSVSCFTAVVPVAGRLSNS